MLTIIFTLIALSIFLMSYSIYMRASVPMPTRLKEGLENKDWPTEAPQKEPILLRFFPLTPLNRLILNKIGRQNLEDKLFLADAKLTPESFLGLQELFALALFVSSTMIIQKVYPLSFIFSILAGFLLPAFAITEKVRKQKRLIMKVFPDTIDLISLCVGAGLDLVQSLKWIVERCRPNPLVREFSRIIKRINMGTSRQGALKGMAKQLGITEITSFINTLIQADRLGTPIYQILLIISVEARRKRFQRAEREALKAPIKMLFPLIFFILPVIGIIVGGPVMIQFIHSDIPKM